MLDFIGIFLYDLFIENLNHIGAAIKWTFLRKKYSYKEILKQERNYTIGIGFIVILVILMLYLTNYWQ